jgi:hypothetical protein
MKVLLKRRLSLTVLFFILLNTLCFAESALKDSLIPDGEKLVYKYCIGNDSCTLTETTIIKEEAGQNIYEINSNSRFEDKLVKIDRKTMSTIFSHSVLKTNEAITDTKITTLKKDRESKSNEIVMGNFNGMLYQLRGFPFKEKKTYRIIGAGAHNPFAINIKMAEEIQVKIGNHDVRCYRLEIGLSGILGVLFPKSSIWYSCDAPNYLVKYEGGSGGPGSQKQLIELIEYSNINR